MFVMEGETGYTMFVMEGRDGLHYVCDGGERRVTLCL